MKDTQKIYRESLKVQRTERCMLEDQLLAWGKVFVPMVGRSAILAGCQESDSFSHHFLPSSITPS